MILAYFLADYQELMLEGADGWLALLQGRELPLETSAPLQQSSFSLVGVLELVAVDLDLFEGALEISHEVKLVLLLQSTHFGVLLLLLLLKGLVVLLELLVVRLQLLSFPLHLKVVLLNLLVVRLPLQLELRDLLHQLMRPHPVPLDDCRLVLDLLFQPLYLGLSFL